MAIICCVKLGNGYNMLCEDREWLLYAVGWLQYAVVDRGWLYYAVEGRGWL